ncbi:MAG: ribosome-associated translation inhibitor RaiA [Gammaproteobacteria bacterium]|jgi:putative sigma-54 modulation protein
MLTITGHKIDITAPLRSLIEKKFKKIEKHFTHGFTKADIVLTVENLNNIAKANIHASGIEVNAHGEAENMYKAIDKMVIKLDRQIVKVKEKMTDHSE